MSIFRIFVIVILVVFSNGKTAWSDTESRWSFTSITTRGKCSAPPGVLTLKGNKITGHVISKDVGKLRVLGRVRNDGTIRGSIGGALASFKGEITGNTGTGTWRDFKGCRGTMSFRNR